MADPGVPVLEQPRGTDVDLKVRSCLASFGSLDMPFEDGILRDTTVQQILESHLKNAPHSIDVDLKVRSHLASTSGFALKWSHHVE